MGAIIAILSGALMSVQAVFNDGVTKKAGIWLAAAFVQITAFIVCVIAWIFTGRNGNVSSIFDVDKKYMLLGGVIGAFITYSVIKGLDILGPARNAQFILVSQLIVAYLIELLGIFGVEKNGFELKKLVAVGIIAVGIIIFKWGQ